MPPTIAVGESVTGHEPAINGVLLTLHPARSRFPNLNQAGATTSDTFRLRNPHLVQELLIQVERPMTTIVTFCVRFSGTNVINLGSLHSEWGKGWKCGGGRGYNESRGIDENRSRRVGVKRMATMLTRPSEVTERRIVLHDIRWATYEALLADYLDRSVPRFTFDQGDLEIVGPSFAHEKYNRALAQIVNAYAEVMGINVGQAGSTTFKREDWKRGFEADSSFYIRNEERMRGKTEVDPTVDPPPDLVIEIDVSSSSLNKLPIYAQFGVPEVWRYDSVRVTIYDLVGGQYVESPESLVLSGLWATEVTRLLEESQSSEPIVWLRALRQWARERRGDN
jgi:Uma2 family endonuclease